MHRTLYILSKKGIGLGFTIAKMCEPAKLSLVAYCKRSKTVAGKGNEASKAQVEVLVALSTLNCELCKDNLVHNTRFSNLSVVLLKIP